MPEHSQSLFCSSPLSMRAELKPLDGRKYYGSEITLCDAKTGQHLETLTIWVMGDFAPSERELADWDEEEYGPWEGDSSHYESKLGYEICKLIVRSINGD